MAVLGTLNQSKKIAGPAQVYLVARPSTGYTGTTDDLKVKSVLGLFFSDTNPEAMSTLTPSIYAELDATGIDIKLKQDAIDFDPNVGGKYKAANGPSECTVTFSYKDIDANKLTDAFSSLASDNVTVTAATGVAGRTISIVGRQAAPLNMALMVRYPALDFPGQYRHIILPWVTITPEFDIKLDKKSIAVAKVTATGITDMSLAGSNPMPPIALMDDVNSASL